MSASPSKVPLPPIEPPPSFYSRTTKALGKAFRQIAKENPLTTVVTSLGTSTVLLNAQHASTLASLAAKTGAFSILTQAMTSGYAGLPISAGIGALTTTGAELACVTGLSNCSFSTVCTAASCSGVAGPAFLLIGLTTAGVGGYSLLEQSKKIAAEVLIKELEEESERKKTELDDVAHKLISGDPLPRAYQLEEPATTKSTTVMPASSGSSRSSIADLVLSIGAQHVTAISLKAANLPSLPIDLKNEIARSIPLVSRSVNSSTSSSTGSSPQNLLSVFKAYQTAINILSYTGGQNSIVRSFQNMLKKEFASAFAHKEAYVNIIKTFLAEQVLSSLDKNFPASPLDPTDSRKAATLYVLLAFSKKIATWVYEHSKYHKTLNSSSTLNLALNLSNFLIPAYFLTRVFANSVRAYTNADPDKTAFQRFIDQFELFLPSPKTSIDQLSPILSQKNKDSLLSLFTPKEFWQLLPTVGVGIFIGTTGKDCLKILLANKEFKSFLGEGTIKTLNNFLQFYPVMYPISRYLIYSIQNPEKGDLPHAISFVTNLYKKIQTKEYVRDLQERVQYNFRYEEAEQRVMNTAILTMFSYGVGVNGYDWLASDHVKKSPVGKIVRTSLFLAPLALEILNYTRALLKPAPLASKKKKTEKK
jgi:hypothetical protein